MQVLNIKLKERKEIVLPKVLVHALVIGMHLGTILESFGADDTGDNEDTSTSQPFDLPLNEDVDEGGEVHFFDFIAISMHYNEKWEPS